MNEEEKEDIELDIEAKYVDRTEKEFLSNITYAECLYILDTKNKYCDDIKNLSLLKIVDIVNEQSKEIEELKNKNKKLRDKAKELIFEKQELTSALLDSTPNDKIKARVEELQEYLYKGNIKDDFLMIRIKAKIQELQSLLEKE